MRWVTAIAFLSACAAPPEPAAPADGPMSLVPDNDYTSLDVPYVPTPAPVVDELLRLTGPRPGEVLMDLGCGDGRIVLTALQRVEGLTGVGVDLDPIRVRQANAGAAELGLTRRARFVEQDLFQTAIEADVVTLYLLPEVNEALRPALFSDLRPGARVASHDFDMADWPPEAQVSLGRHRVFLWVMPESVAGLWVVESEHAHLPSGAVVEVVQGFQWFAGTADDGALHLRGQVDGHEVNARAQPITGPAAHLRARVVETAHGQWLEGLYDLEPFRARRLTVGTIHMERVDSDKREY